MADGGLPGDTARDDGPMLDAVGALGTLASDLARGPASFGDAVRLFRAFAATAFPDHGFDVVAAPGLFPGADDGADGGCPTPREALRGWLAAASGGDEGTAAPPPDVGGRVVPVMRGGRVIAAAVLCGPPLTTAQEMLFDTATRFASLGLGALVQERELALLREALLSSEEATVLYDAEDMVVFSNPAYHRVFAHYPPPDRLVGMTHLELYQLDLGAGVIDDPLARTDPSAYLAGRAVMARSLTGSRQEIQRIRDRVYLYSRHRTPWGGSVSRRIDVTELFELSERLRQSQKLEAVGQLTGGIVHDFNNFLTVIISSAELLGNAVRGDRQLKTLADLTLTAANRGAELTSRLLAFARTQVLDPRRIEVGQLLLDMRELLQRTVVDTVAIEVRPAPQLLVVELDPGQLEGAILNLALNARDAMPGGGTITLAARAAVLDGAALPPELTPGRYVVVSVSDTGTGMTPDVLQRAFEPFFTTKEAGKGSGLGLSMVYGFVRQTGGSLEIESAPGRGTTVRLILPDAGGAAAHKPEVAPDEEPAGGTEHVLVVEDDAMVRAHVVLQLTGLGYRVTETITAEEALRALRGGAAPDVVLSDVRLPSGMDGKGLAAAIAREWPGLKVVLTSGYPLDRAELPGSLPVRFLHKPYGRAELAARLREVLDAPR